MEKEVVLITEGTPSALKLSEKNFSYECLCGCFVFIPFGDGYKCNACSKELIINDKCVDCHDIVDLGTKDTDNVGPYCERCYGSLPNEFKESQI